MAAFGRARTPPQPETPRPRPKVEPDPDEFSEEALEMIVEAYALGTLEWNARRMGPPPDAPGTRIPLHIRRRLGFA